MVLLRLVVIVSSVTCTLADNSLFGVGPSVRPSVLYDGCFRVDHFEDRGLNHTLLPFTLNSCVRLCMVKDTRYAGAEARRQTCYCLNDKIGQGEAHAACHVTCRGQKSYTCGGVFRMSLYQIKDSSTPGFITATKKGLQFFRNYTLARGYIKTPLDSHHVSVDYDYSMSEVYTSSGNRIQRMSYAPLLKQFLPPTTVVELVVGTARVNLIRIAYDWVSRTLFCAYEVLDGWYCINSVELATNHVESVAECTRHRLRDLAVDPFNRKVVYISGEYISYVDVTTGYAVNNSLAEFGFSYITKLALDIQSERAYMVAPSGWGYWYLLSSRYDLTDLRVLTRRPQLATAFSLRFFQSQLFWGETTGRGRSFLYHTSVTSSGLLQNITELARLPSSLKTMMLYHKDVQQSANVFFCAMKGCSHECSFNGVLAECWCPRSHTLAVDGRTCEEMDHMDGGPTWQESDSGEDLEGSGSDFLE